MLFIFLISCLEYKVYCFMNDFLVVKSFFDFFGNGSYGYVVISKKNYFFEKYIDFLVIIDN